MRSLAASVASPSVEVRSLVTVVLPAWNEEQDILGCLKAIAAQEYGRESIEIILADARSTDATAAVGLSEARALGLRLTVVDNPLRRTSSGLNRALDAAAGDFVVRVDARSRIQATYVSTCVAVLTERPEVGVVGGAQVAVPRSTAPVHQAIARALANRLTMGLSRYRRTATSGPADTVWMGAFRRDELRRLGGWNEAVALNEDFELNQRYRRAGKLVWFEASLRSRYLPRQSFDELGRQYFRFGHVKGTWWARGEPLLPRHALLLAAPPVYAGVVAAVVRRLGPPAAVATAAAGVLGLDAIGADETASLPVRALSSAAIVTICGSWWVGVIAGYFVERLRPGHELG